MATLESVSEKNLTEVGRISYVLFQSAICSKKRLMTEDVAGSWLVFR